MTLSVMDGVGPIIIDRYEQGAPAGMLAHTYLTVGTLTFTPGVLTTDLMGGDGTTIARIATGATPIIAIEASEKYPVIEAGRLLGRATDGPANTAPAAFVREVFLTAGDSLLEKSAAQAIIDGLTIADGARSGIYELAVTVASGAVAVIVRRISPAPSIIEPTTLFSTWAAGTPAALAVASPTDGDTGSYFLQVHDPVLVTQTVDFRDPTIYYHRILAWSGQSGGNTRAFLVADPCVASGEDPLTMERGAVDTSSMNFTVLGGNAQLEIVQFAKTIAAAGLV